MHIRLNQREVAGVIIIDVCGRIDLGEGSKSLRYTILELSNQGKKKVILNLAETFYIDSSGLGELVSGFTTLQKQGAQLKLLALRKKVKEFLQITSLYTVFEVFEDEETAIASFN